MFYPQREVCYATMERESANAKWQEIHKDRTWHNGTWSEWVKNRDDEHPVPRDAGLTIGVTLEDIRPDDLFLIQENCGPPTALPEPDEEVSARVLPN